MSVTIAFNMANLVAHYSDYRFKLADWSAQHELAVARTDLPAWEDLCARIAAAGYDAVEVWVAHVERCTDDAERADRFGVALERHGLRPIALAAGLTDATATICQRLKIPCVCGTIRNKDTAIGLMRSTGILVNHENHPEKSVAEIREQIDGGANGLAVALDTGWLATQGVEAAPAVRELGRLIRHVHVKDVAAFGGHETVPLGIGVVDVPAVLRELKAIGYEGVLSWEDEPEDRNPFEVAAAMREYLLKQWADA